MRAPTFAIDFEVHVNGVGKGKFTDANFLSESYGFGCKGMNESPSISWEGAPSETKSFVLSIHDIDASTDVGWMHWVVANIPAQASSLPSGVSAEGKELPAGAIQTRTDFGVPGYGGPCPPQGSIQRFVITLKALDIDKLPLVTKDATPALVGFFINAHVIGRASVTVSQSR